MNDILITHLILALLFLGVSFMMKIWPPKRINYLYGYRTSRSMKNQLNWDIANRLAADFMMWAGITNVGVHVLSYLIIGGTASIFVPLGYYLIFILISIYFIEKRLQQSGQ